MSEMIERVAREIMKIDAFDLSQKTPCQEHYRMARAAIAATNIEKLHAAVKDLAEVIYSGTAYEGSEPSYYNGSIADVFKALNVIEAILAEEEPAP